MTATQQSAPEPGWWRFVPMAGWIRSYERSWLRGDLIAGVAVAALIVALVVVFGARVIAPRIPGALVLVVGRLLVSWLFDLGAHGVALVLIGFSQTAGDARTFAARHHYRIDINQESAAQGWPTSARACFRACRSPPACPRVH